MSQASIYLCRNTLAAALGLLLALASTPAAAQGAAAWPTKPVKVIVAFTAGGTTDTIARSVGQQLAERLKQPFVIDNKPGAGGNIGTAEAVRAPADGYTLIVNTVGPMAVNATLYRKLGHNPQTDLAPVVLIADVPNVLVVPPSIGVKTMDEFLAFAKANAGKLNYGSTGIGTSAHLSGFVFAKRAGFEATHVPYKGAEALKDLLAGRIQFMFATIPSVIAHIRGGTLQALAVSSPKRSRALPEVATVADSGFPGFEAGSWTALFAPKGTPPAVVAQLNQAVNQIIAVPDMQQQLIREGADPMGGTPEQLAQFVQRETEKWRAVIRDTGVTVE